ncbi:MAG: hypothetical protein HYV35_04500 [Lentisphaerae bacterium]|nr:hypothetical protein [Lentisphaerota bacterium]
MKTGESGVVLEAVVIFGGLACILAAGIYVAGSSTVVSSARTIRFEKAFLIAEAGAERAKADLSTNADNINTILTGADGLTNTSDDGILSFGAAVPFGGGAFSTRVWDNNDSDPSLFVDTDWTVIIRSTGACENVQRVLELAVTVSNPPAPPADSDGALAIYGSNTTVDVGGNSSINGNDWGVPDDFDCTGAACDGTLTTNPAGPGVFSSTNTTPTIGGSAVVVGDPPVTNNATGDYDAQYWQAQVDYWTPLASLSISGSVPNDAYLGTRDNPQVTLATGDVNIDGNVSGAGVLIVQPGVDITIAGTFHYEGLVILLGNVTCTALGTADIFGAVTVVGGDNSVSLNGFPSIKYSTEALANLVNLPLPGPLAVQYWREIK